MDAEFKAIMRRVESSECGIFIPWWTGEPRHDRKCTRCEDEKNAKDMKITKHEWPLPEDEVSAKAIIFELSPPQPILSWRDATWFIVQDIGRPGTSRGPPVSEVLTESEPLASFVWHRDRRVTLASAVKPMYKAHYFKSGLNMDDIFVKNGLKPLMHDTNARNVWTTEQMTTPSLSRYCSSQLSATLNEHLGPQVNMTTHSHNSVVAKQSACPSEMSPHEFLLFGSMRSGARLQWMNVLATLMSSEFDLNSPNAATLFLHAISQVGKGGDTNPKYLRESQIELTTKSFCESLLNALEANFQRIETNWKEATAASVLLMVTLKLLSLTSHTEIHARSMALVLQIRKSGVQWIRQLAVLHSEKKTELTGSQALEDISRQLVNICILTKNTYDVDEGLQTSAFESRNAVADYIEACLHLHDHREQACSNSESKQASSLLNDDYHSRLCERFLLEALVNDNEAISEGVKRYWPSANLTAHWEIVNKKDTSWLMTKASSMVVHYNLVTGSLLVAGRPLSRLPTSYTSNPLYRSVLAHLDLDVFSSDDDDMEYMSRVLFEGHRLYFGMRGQELLIRSRKSDQVYEAILRDNFLGDLPDSIVKNTIPWMSLHDGRVSFRRNDQRWLSDKNDWTLFPDINSRSTIAMHTKKAFLIDKDSAVGSVICEIFRPFEQQDHIVITKYDNTEIGVSLPRYHLNFFVTYKGEVQCKELAAVVDSSQAIGTLYGLKSRLVLRAAGSMSGSAPRSILIPNGEVKILAASPHVEVDVILGNEDKLTFSSFQIDERLGQLNPDNLEGHLFKAYLHAVTSFPEYDTLTGRTGTEECLLSLSDPIAMTSIPISRRSRAMLHAISQLSPKRTLYPPGINTMQTVVFHKTLSWYSQRDIFFGTASAIVEHNLKTSFLFDAKDETQLSYQGDLQLLGRSHQRSCKLYPCGTLGEVQNHRADRWYKSRDQCISKNQKAAASLAALIGAWPSAFTVQPNLKAMAQNWQDLGGFHEEFIISSVSRLLSEDFKTQFASLFSYCKSSASSAASLTFILPYLAFGHPETLSQLRTLLAFAVSPRLKALPDFNFDTYDLKLGYAFDENDILTILSECEYPFQPARVSERNTSDSEDPYLHERNEFKRELEAQREEVLEAAECSWPADSMRLPPESDLGHYNYGKLATLLNARFATWYKNYVFLSQLDAGDKELGQFHNSWSGPETTIDTLLPFDRNPADSGQSTLFCVIELMQLVKDPEKDFNLGRPSCMDQDLTDLTPGKERHNQLDANELRCAWEELDDITEELMSQTSRPIVQNYGRFLKESIHAARRKAEKDETKVSPPKRSVLTQKGKKVRDYIDYILTRTRALLQPCLKSHQALVEARLWPQVSQLTLLQLLSPEHRNKVPPGWIKILLCFAHEITALQRVERLQKYLVSGDKFALQRELANPAHADWSTEQHPDWLLLEVQNNMLIRPVQIRVALELIKSENGVVLLGMGEGKTSVILPMVITALTASNVLVRVVVLKPLATEMLRLLSKTLAGFCGRAVYYLPFSRQTPLNTDTPQLLMDLYRECRQNAGVLLTLPEYLNSFRLASADLLDGETNDLATKLMRVQQWLDCNARDVLDESDELLKPGYELVYTNGEAAVLSGAPDRWIIALEILALVQLHATKLHTQCPTGIELEQSGRDRFPHFRVISDEGAVLLSKCLIDQILSNGLPGLPLGYCNPETLEALRSFLSDREVGPAQFQVISDHFGGSTQLDTLYVIRGLISHEVLVHALHKRWLVNYGLDRSRSLAAVPYRAKSVPSPSAEFAQPETLIILTALSFFYTGIQRHDMRRCILILLRSSDPGEEYSKWVAGSSLPAQYRNASSLNLDDAFCIDQVFAHLHKNRALIDFFLRQVVYPKEAKFRHKLSSSAWDLWSTEGGKVTSGFSGTCDSQIPTSCVQKDLEDLRHATASTLATLLRHDNRHYTCAATPTGQRLSTDALLQLVVEQPISLDVIIDVGALFLEENREIASKWLGLCASKEAAIFFNANDEKMVLSRDGTTEPFASSIFKDKVSGCLIYLDEFHTRGTDFQLPDNFKAAVLLGPGILKDSLAQAGMRMRKLAFSQSVRFFAPPEVDNSIRAFVNDASEEIDSSHVIRWSISQSCQALESQQPVWAMKGMSHARRRLAAAQFNQSNANSVDNAAYLDTIREQESYPVSEMYPVGNGTRKRLPFEPTEAEMEDPIMRDLAAEWHRTDTTNFQDHRVSEEQEREVLHEVENEREVQKPMFATPAAPEVSRFLVRLLCHGEISDHTEDLYPAFDILKHTRLAATYVAARWPKDLLVTLDFMRTIDSVNQSTEDNFLRPAAFILKVNCVEQPIVISPHEAQVFVPYLRSFQRGRLFLYQARTGKHMAPFDGLQVYQIPESSEPVNISATAITTLNLFAGQLYFSTFEEYQRLCDLIGLWDGERELLSSRSVGNDNFVSLACRKANGWSTDCRFDTSPVKMLSEFIGMRRLGQEWRHTHLGRILTGRLLRRAEFEDDLPAEIAPSTVDESTDQKKDTEDKAIGKDAEGNWFADRCELS